MKRRPRQVFSCKVITTPRAAEHTETCIVMIVISKSDSSPSDRSAPKIAIFLITTQFSLVLMSVRTWAAEACRFLPTWTQPRTQHGGLLILEQSEKEINANYCVRVCVCSCSLSVCLGGGGGTCSRRENEESQTVQIPLKCKRMNHSSCTFRWTGSFCTINTKHFQTDAKETSFFGVFFFFFFFCVDFATMIKEKRNEASSHSPVPPCTCWILALEDKACSGEVAARRRSSTRAEMSASSPPSRAVVVHRQAGSGAAECGAQCRESHGCRIRGDFSLNRLWFLCSPKVFFFSLPHTLSLSFFFFFYTPGLIIPPATMWLLTLSLPCTRQRKTDDDDDDGCTFFFFRFFFFATCGFKIYVCIFHKETKKPDVNF